MAIRYRRIKVQNDWEYRTYYLGDQKINEKVGGTARVKWPDNTVEEIAFRSVWDTREYMDHGHRCSTRWYALLLTVNHHGHEIDVPLEDVLVGEVVQRVAA
jgi:hypothetical protein